MSIEGLLIGRVLGGRYRIEEVIGRGGMGAVYGAMDERLGRLVALKVITMSGPGDADSRERLRARFFREARSAAALPHHPNVVPVYDYGSDEELGLDYLVMELLRGADLATRLARTGPPPLSAALKILIEAARGIAVGHRQGLIHRDVKPGNIFLTEPHPNEVQVRVVDFGIAKLADEDDTLGQLTQDGRVPHSPAYASPEQLRGLSQLTAASDVFSLGAVGYQLLTGERPFTDEDRNRMQLGMSVEPRPTRELNPAIPASIDALVRRALAIEPQRRFRDAEEMATELERAMRQLADQPIDPYLAGATIVTAADGDTPEPTDPVPDGLYPTDDDDDDRTQLVFDDDDRTLLAPPPPSSRPSPVPPPRTEAPAAAPPPRRPAAGKGAPPPARSARPKRAAPPPFVPPKKSRGGLFVWSLVAVTLLVAGMWLFNEMTKPADGPSLAEQLELPEVVEVVDTPEVVDTVPSAEDRARELDRLGRQAYDARRFDEAYQNLQAAVQLDPNVYEYRRNLGLTMIEIGDANGAENQFRRAIALDPAVAPAYYDLHRSQVALGDTLGAIRSLQMYVARESRQVPRASAASRLAELQASQNPAAPPLLGEEVGSPSSGQGPTAPRIPSPLSASSAAPRSGDFLSPDQRSDYGSWNPPSRNLEPGRRTPDAGRWR